MSPYKPMLDGYIRIYTVYKYEINYGTKEPTWLI